MEVELVTLLASGLLLPYARADGQKSWTHPWTTFKRRPSSSKRYGNDRLSFQSLAQTGMIIITSTSILYLHTYTHTTHIRVKNR